MSRSLERFDKQLQDWLAKDPANTTNNKRKCKGCDGEESPDRIKDGTRSKKRILFSQFMIGNPTFNPSSGQVLETTNGEDILSGTTLGNSSTRVDRESGSKEDGDQTFVEDPEEDSHVNMEEIVEMSDGVSIDEEDTFISTESSLTSDNGDADDHVEQIEETPKLTRKCGAPAKETTDNLTKFAHHPTATIGIEILDTSDGEDDDDIFSDASSVASMNLCKLAILDSSSEKPTVDEIFVKPQRLPKQKTTQE